MRISQFTLIVIEDRDGCMYLFVLKLSIGLLTVETEWIIDSLNCTGDNAELMLVTSILIQGVEHFDYTPQISN